MYCFVHSETSALGQARAATPRTAMQVCEYEVNYQTERRIANEIMDTVHKLQLPFKLDQLTEGRGNCFPISIMQQCRRPEIYNQLKSIPKMLAKHRSGHSALRYNVIKFILRSEQPRLVTFRIQYEETDGRANSETWEEYWKRMIIDKTWVDYWFVQATAWYLQLDLWIVATSSTDDSPYIEISGNLEDGNSPSKGPIITLGTKSNCHYQYRFCQHFQNCLNL